MLALANAHDFAECGKTQSLGLNSITLNPDPVVTGSNLDVILSGTPSVGINGGTATLKVKYMGVTLLTEDFDLCSDLGVSCPLNAGETLTAKISYPIPGAAPAVTATAEVDVVDSAGNSLDCVTLKVTLSKGLDEMDIDSERELFSQYMAHFDKSYSMEEYAHKFQVFRENLKTIEAHNAGEHSYSLGLTPFTDLTTEEFRSIYMSGYNNINNHLMREKNYQWLDTVDMESAIDWVDRGAVTDVKDQGQCGSCWSFSTTGAIEGRTFVETGTLYNLSEQNLMDCSYKNGNMGCNGGLMDNAFQYVISNGGLCSESDYSYQEKSRLFSCKASSCDIVADTAIQGFSDVPSGDADQLIAALQGGPVSIALNGAATNFQHYTGGILTGSCEDQLDHGVLVVGYGTDNGVDYWKVKNSWSSSWGEDGYIRIERGSNLCGLLDQPSYPTF
jgi:cathepsin L